MALTIGQVARAAKVHVETLRYYERRGIVPKPPRGPAMSLDDRVQGEEPDR